MGATRAYIVVCLERTDSNLLGAALAATGFLGEPDEWLGRSRLHTRLRSMGLADPRSTTEEPWPRSFSEYIRALDLTTTRQGIFGVKLHYYQYAAAVTAGWVGDLLDVVPESARDNTVVIRLRRRDHAAQAVSTLRAQVSGVYVRPVGEPAVEPVRHFRPYWVEQEVADAGGVHAELDRIVRVIEQHEAAWDSLLGRIGLSTMDVDYETLASDYVEVARKAIEFVGERSWRAEDVVPPRTLQQADETSARMLDDYLAHRGDSW